MIGRSGAVFVERRYVGDIIRGALADGWRVGRHFGGVESARPSSFLVHSDIGGADDVLVPLRSSPVILAAGPSPSGNSTSSSRRARDEPVHQGSRPEPENEASFSRY
jgi:hypothetical protein